MFSNFYQETSGCYDLQSAVLRIPATTILFLGCLPMRILILEDHSIITHGPSPPIEIFHWVLLLPLVNVVDIHILGHETG